MPRLADRGGRASGPPATAAALERVPYKGPIRALLEEDFADGKLRVLLTLRAHDLAGCGSLATTVTRAPATTTIAIAGIDRDPASLMCAFMERPAPSASFDLTHVAREVADLRLERVPA